MGFRVRVSVRIRVNVRVRVRVRPLRALESVLIPSSARAIRCKN